MASGRKSNARVRRKLVVSEATARVPILGVPPIVAVAPPLVPVVTSGLRGTERLGLTEGRPNIHGGTLTFQDLHAQSIRCMECDVTMHQPNSGVVGLKGNDHITIGGQKHNIPAWRIVQLQV